MEIKGVVHCFFEQSGTFKEEFEKADYDEKMRFIKKILSLATHNAFTKDDLLFLLKWQFEQNEQLKEKIKILEAKKL